MNVPAASPDPHAALKKAAAEYAVRYVESGMTVGLGTGSTAIFAIRRIGALAAERGIEGHRRLRDLAGIMGCRS